LRQNGKWHGGYLAESGDLILVKYKGRCKRKSMGSLPGKQKKSRGGEKGHFEKSIYNYHRGSADEKIHHKGKKKVKIKQRPGRKRHQV